MRALVPCLLLALTTCAIDPTGATADPLTADAGPSDAGADCWYHETWTWPIACTFAADGAETCVLTGDGG